MDDADSPPQGAHNAAAEPEPVPIEIIGISKNMWGPKQDIILAKMLGKALRTNVAKGMSGSPVYIGGKLIGALSLGLSQFGRKVTIVSFSLLGKYK